MKVNMAAVVTSLIIAGVLGGVGLFAKSKELEVKVRYNEKGIDRVYKMQMLQNTDIKKILRRLK